MNPLLNPWVLLAVVVAWGSSCAGAFYYGTKVEGDHKDAVEAREQHIAQVAGQAAAASAADVIANLRPVYTTIQAKVQHDIETNTVYRECVHPAGSLRNVNAALAGELPSSAADYSLLPEAHTASGPLLRGNDGQAR